MIVADTRNVSLSELCLIFTGFVSSVMKALASLTERSWVQILGRYSGWPSHYINVGCSAMLKTSFELNPYLLILFVYCVVLYYENMDLSGAKCALLT